MVAGAVIGCFGAVSPGAAGATAVAGLALAALDGPLRLWRPCVLTAVCAAAAAHGVNDRNEALRPSLLAWFGDDDAGEQAPIQMDGRLLADADLTAAGVARLRVAVDRVRAADGWRAVEGVVQLHVAGDAARAMAEDWTRGRRVRAPATLRLPQFTRNPGTPDLNWQALIRGYVLTGSVKSGALVTVGPGPWIEERAAALRRHVRDALRRASAGRPGLTTAIVTAVLIGDRAGLDPETIRRLQDAGTYHVIAISGGNVALVLVAVLVVLRLVVRSFRVLSLVALVCALAYGWVVGSQPSVDRAVAAACVYLMADVAGLLISPLDVLAVVAGGLALVDPVAVVEPAAWLSCGATAGILLAADRMRARASSSSARSSRAGAIARWVSIGAGATLAAELALLPVGASVFTRVSLAGLVLNLIAIPAMAVIQCAGVLVVLLSGWADRGAVWCLRVAEVACGALLGSARLVDAAPWLVWRMPPPATAWVVVYYAGLSAWLVWRRPRLRLLGAACAAMACAAIVLAPTLRSAAPRPAWLRLTVVDVGQGDALLLQVPGGRSLGIDAGMATEAFDMGERVVTPTAWALGIRRLDWLAFTHPDLDHIGGAAAVASILRPREIWEGVPVARDAPRQRLRVRADEAGTSWREVRAGDVLDEGPVRLEILNPPRPDWERWRVRNDDSIVMRVRYGDVEFLLTGDAGEAVEAALPVDDDDRPRLRVLKVGHHGSRTSSSAAFIARYRPALALVSVGRDNPFGHPNADVMARLVSQGADVFRTDRDGALIVETDGHEVRLRTWTGRQWRARIEPPPA
jgi:competence protein ComEC